MLSLNRPGRVDFPLLFVTVALIALGVLFIYSSNRASSASFRSAEHTRQILWAVLGGVLLVFTAVFDLSVFRRYAFVAYVVIIILLLLTLFFGRVVNGARRWIGIGNLGMQPSEFAKIVVILVLARVMDTYSGSLHKLGHFMILLGIAAVPAALILVQPDLGTALAVVPVVFAMALVAGASLSHLVFFGTTGVLTIILAVLPAANQHLVEGNSAFLSVFGETGLMLLMVFVFLGVTLLCWVAKVVTGKQWFRWLSYGAGISASSLMGAMVIQRALRPFQVMRLIVFLNPNIDPRGAGWHTIQSLTAVGSGGLAGKGFLQGTQSQLQYLPQQSTDFIFSILAEELGFMGVLLVFALYGFLLFRGLVISLRARDTFSGLVAAGVVTLFAFQFFVNVGMTIGIMPITGIPLKLMSFGGSSLWSAMIAVGLLLNIAARSRVREI